MYTSYQISRWGPVPNYINLLLPQYKLECLLDLGTDSKLCCRQNARGRIVCQEVVLLQPPSGFSDGQKLSEAECDHEAASDWDSLTALPLFCHEELEQELSVLVRFVMTLETWYITKYEAGNAKHVVVPVSSAFQCEAWQGTFNCTVFNCSRNGKGLSWSWSPFTAVV
jgi:hypothetical protein